MEKSVNKKAIIVITSIVLLGVGGFFAYKWNKKRVAKKAEEAKKIADAAAAAAAADKSKDDKPKADKPKADKPKYTFPAAWTTKEGDAFRAWVIAKDKKFADSIQLDATGELNDYVQKAWDKYGVDYLKPATTPPKPKTKVKVADLLASGINKGNMKVLYAGVSGIEVKNLDGQTTAKTIANGIVGVITSAVKVDNTIGKGYRLNFQTGTGLSLYTYSYNNKPNDFYIML